MYIEPNSTILICKGVHLDNTYTNTILFDSASAQASYFASVTKYKLDRQSYQRVEKGRMRVEVTSENLYDCNYIAFRNTNFGDKWFYAFITGVEYVNNITSEIRFEIDEMQTYLFDVVVGQCFVEREHSATDNVGDNIQYEPVATGEYVNSDHKKLLGNDMLIAVMYADNGSASYHDNILSGYQIKLFAETDYRSAGEFIDSYIQNPDNILAVYMLPKIVYGQDVEIGGITLPDYYSGVSYSEPLPALDSNASFQGFVPKNKKLYTYPYNFIRIDNGNGQSLNLRYEFFKSGINPRVYIDTAYQLPVKVLLRPVQYKGVESSDPLYDVDARLSTESLVLDNYPICSYGLDSFRSWLSQNIVPTAIQTGLTVASTLGALIAGTTSGAGVALAGAALVGNIISKTYAASIEADQCRGNTSNGSANWSAGMQNFFYNRVHITKDYAQMIDNYFTRYGYATNKLKIPNRSARPHWSYVKTVGCNAFSKSAPADSVSNIIKIYDKGITFWKNPNEIGDYSIDNSV